MLHPRGESSFKGNLVGPLAVFDRLRPVTGGSPGHDRSFVSARGPDVAGRRHEFVFPNTLPPLTPKDRDKFVRIFTNSHPEDGLVPGAGVSLLSQHRLIYELLERICRMESETNHDEVQASHANP